MLSTDAGSFDLPDSVSGSAIRSGADTAYPVSYPPTNPLASTPNYHPTYPNVDPHAHPAPPSGKHVDHIRRIALLRYMFPRDTNQEVA